MNKPLSPLEEIIYEGMNTWIKQEGDEGSGALSYYLQRIERHLPLVQYEKRLLKFLCQAPTPLAIDHVGCGFAPLSIALAAHGHRVTGYEGYVPRARGARFIHSWVRERWLPFDGEFQLVEGLFPEARIARTQAGDAGLLLYTNVGSTGFAAMQAENIASMAHYSAVILDLSLFGANRNTKEEQDALLATILQGEGRRAVPITSVNSGTTRAYHLICLGELSPLFDLVANKAVGVVAGDNAYIEQGSGVHMRADNDIEFSGRGDLKITTYGDIIKMACPVCGSKNIDNAWRIPMTKIDPPITVFGGYFDQVPTLQTPFELFCFDLCQDCESLFLNPDLDRERLIATYKKSVHYISKMKEETEWPGYEERYKDMLKFVPQGAETLVDAACGMGQILFVARKTNAHPWKRMIGLELSEAYVQNMKESGFEAHCFDLDRDDQRAVVGQGVVDFISFFEAFEHVASPLSALGKLLDMLRPGGRVYFSAQRYGEGVKLSIRPGEPIYIGRRVLDRLPALLRCKIVNVSAAGSRYFVVLEKTSEPTPLLQAEMPTARRNKTRSALKIRQANGKVLVDLALLFQRDSGHCFVVKLPEFEDANHLLGFSDVNEAPRRSPLELLEDGRPLGPAHAPHASIRVSGKGAFSHWGGDLYMSSSDNTDPNTNGRTYTIAYPA